MDGCCLLAWWVMAGGRWSVVRRLAGGERGRVGRDVPAIANDDHRRADLPGCSQPDPGAQWCGPPPRPSAADRLRQRRQGRGTAHPTRLGRGGRSGVTALSAGPAALSRLGLLRVLCRAVLGTWLVGGVALGRRVVRGLGRQGARRDLDARLRVVVLAVTTGGQRQRGDGYQRSAGDQTLMADARACGSGSRSTDRSGATPPQQPPLPRSAPPTSISPAAPHTPPCPEPTTPDRAGRAQSAGSIRSPRKQERAHL